MKLNIGGTSKIDGWYNLNKYQNGGIDFVQDARDLSNFLDGNCTHVHCSHLLEHFTHIDAFKIVKEVYRILKPDGTFSVSVPNLDELCNLYAIETDEQDKFVLSCMMLGGQTNEEDTHRSGWTPAILSEVLFKAGFTKGDFVSHFPEMKDTSCRDFKGSFISLNCVVTK